MTGLGLSPAQAMVIGYINASAQIGEALAALILLRRLGLI